MRKRAGPWERASVRAVNPPLVALRAERDRSAAAGHPGMARSSGHRSTPPLEYRPVNDRRDPPASLDQRRCAAGDSAVARSAIAAHRTAADVAIDRASKQARCARWPGPRVRVQRHSRSHRARRGLVTHRSRVTQCASLAARCAIYAVIICTQLSKMGVAGLRSRRGWPTTGSSAGGVVVICAQDNRLTIVNSGAIAYQILIFVQGVTDTLFRAFGAGVGN